MKTSEKNLKLKGGMWLVDKSEMQANGKLKRFRIAFPTKTEAQNHLALLRSQKAMRRLGFEIPEAKKSDRLFEDFAEEFIARHSLGRPKTRLAHRGCLTALLRSDLFKGKRISEITTESIAKYHAERGAKWRVSSNRELGFLKQVLQRAQDFGEISINPAARVKKFRESRTKLRILTDDEAARLLKAADPHLAPVLKVLLMTAMRPHEVFALRWAYDGWDTEKRPKSSVVSLKKKLIFIPAALAKNHRDREIPISAELLALFEALPRDSSGKVFPMNSAPKSFRSAVKAAELKNVSLYTLKHTAASRMVRAGVDLVTVCELIGHSDVKTTMIYCHSSSETKREAVEKLSRIYAPGPQPAAAPPEAQTITIPSPPRKLYN